MLIVQTAPSAARRQESFHITCQKSRESCFWESSNSSVKLQTQAVKIRVRRMMARIRMLKRSRKRTGTQVMRRRPVWQTFLRICQSRWDNVTWLRFSCDNHTDQHKRRMTYWMKSDTDSNSGYSVLQNVTVFLMCVLNFGLKLWLYFLLLCFNVGVFIIIVTLGRICSFVGG